MPFADELKSHLLQVQQGQVQAEPRFVELDTAWVLGTAVQLFEQLEQQGSQPGPKEFEEKFRAWMAGPVPEAERFSTRLSHLLQGSFLKGAPRAEIERYVRLGLALQIGAKAEVPSLSRGLELKRLAALARSWQSTHDNGC